MDPADSPASSVVSAARPGRAPIAVIGADSVLGEAVTRDAILRGIPVRSIAEHPERVARISPAQEIFALSGTETSALEAALHGARGVILALEPDPRVDRTALVLATLRAMRALEIERVVASSSLALLGPAEDPQADTRLAAAAASVARSALRALPLRRSEQRAPQAVPAPAQLLDLRRMEMLLAGSGLDWSLVRAGSLSDLLGTRTARLVPADGAGRDAATRTVAREDLARMLLELALAPGTEPRLHAVAADS